jgi:hypothetical protein
VYRGAVQEPEGTTTVHVHPKLPFNVPSAHAVQDSGLEGDTTTHGDGMPFAVTFASDARPSSIWSNPSRMDGLEDSIEGRG